MRLTAINPSTSVTLTTDYRIVLDSSGNIHFIQNNDISPTSGIGTDTLGTHGEGIMKPIVGSFSSVSFNGNYVFLFAGQDLTAKPAALAGAIRANGNGLITTAAGGVGSDFNDNGSIQFAEPFRKLFGRLDEQPRHCGDSFPNFRQIG